MKLIINMNRTSVLTLVIFTLPVAPQAAYAAHFAQPDIETTSPDSTTSLFRNYELSPTNLAAAQLYFDTKQDSLGYTDLLDYAMVHMLQDRFTEAALLYELATKHASNDQERVAALVWQCQALLDSTSNLSSPARESTFSRAGIIINKAALLSPQSREIAVLRTIAWTNAKDELELLVAQHDLKRLGVELDSKEVVLPLAGLAVPALIMATTGSAIAVTTTAYVLLSDLTPEQKIDRLIEITRTVMLASVMSKVKLPKSIAY